MLDLLCQASEKINATFDELTARYKRTCYAHFALILYNGQPERNAGTRKAYCQFVAEGKKAHLVRFNRDSYNEYLRRKGFEDSEKNREAWAMWYWNENYNREDLKKPQNPQRDFERDIVNKLADIL